MVYKGFMGFWSPDYKLCRLYRTTIANYRGPDVAKCNNSADMAKFRPKKDESLCDVSGGVDEESRSKNVHAFQTLCGSYLYFSLSLAEPHLAIGSTRPHF